MDPRSAVATAVGTCVLPARRLRSSERKRGASGFLEVSPSSSPARNTSGFIGDTLRSKMDAQPHIEHRGLILINNTAAAQALVEAYNLLPNKPQARPGVPIVLESYFNPVAPDHPSKVEMQTRLNRFKITSDPNPIHVLIQCAKLGEGYDQPNISVVGICSNVGKLSKFAQFSGRAVRKLGPGTVEQGLVSTVTDARDNVAHIITHEKFKQLDHWGPFTTQEGFGEFNPLGEDDDDDDEVDDNATTASDLIPLDQRYSYPEMAGRASSSAGSSSEDPEPLSKKLKSSNASRKVDRYVLARTQERQAEYLTAEKGQHDKKSYMEASWDFVNRHTVPAD